MGRFQRSLALFKSSWRVVKSDRELLVLPVISGLASLVLVGAFAAPVWMSMSESTSVDPAGSTASLQPTVWTYLLGAAFYFCTAFVVVFCNAALVSGANERFEGGDPTVGSALRGAWRRVGLIAQWAAVSATVSVAIRQIQERGGLLGRILGGFIGFAWAVVTFLVLPTLVIEGVGVKEAFTRSAEAIRSTWGENLIGQGGLGLAGFVAMLPVILVGGAGAALLSTSVTLGVVLLVVAAIGLLGVTVVVSAMGVVYQTALYRFATRRPVSGFDQAALTAAFAPKTGRGAMTR